MLQNRKQQDGEWLDEAKLRLASLYESYAARSEDFDILPTQAQKDSAIAFLVEMQHDDAPKIGTTVNAEITLVWLGVGDKFKAYVQRDGSIICMQNKTEVAQGDFVKVVTRIPA